MLVVMLTPFFTSVLPKRFRSPQLQRSCDQSPAKAQGETKGANARAKNEAKGQVTFFAGVLLLATAALLTSAALRSLSLESRTAAVPESGPFAAMAAGQASAVLAASTDGRAVSDLDEASSTDRDAEPIVAMLDRNCAAHAREKLLVGLTNYYLQRSLRPEATSDDAAETSFLTAVLTGPGDPAATTPETSCKG
jgi:hypothetical protein